MNAWIVVRTETGLKGYVFGGYLEESVENIDFIRALEGKYVYNTGYIDDYDEKTLTVKYKGGNYFSFTSRLANFPC